MQLADRTIAPAVVNVDQANAALSRVVHREGWLAVEGHEEVWAVPLPLGTGGANLIARSFDCEPDVDGIGVWVQGRDIGTFCCVDGRSGAEVRRVHLGADARLDAVTPKGFVVRRSAELMLVQRHEQAPEPLGEGKVLASCGNVLLLMNRDGLMLRDLARGTLTTVQDPGVGRWQTFASFSPDGRQIAIGADRDRPAPVRRPTNWADLPPYEGKPSMLVVIDAVTGESAVANGLFDNFAWRPVWSNDGEWVVFGAPFERRQLRLVSLRDLTLQAVPFRSNPPMPTLDATQLIGQLERG